jgi:septation ring formation regulator EzrA
MKRLKKKAIDRNELNLEVAEKSLEGIEVAIENILDSYKELFNRLNSLHEEYPRLHKNIIRLVRFPNEYDIRDIADMQLDLKKVKSRYDSDKDYLKDNM